VNIPAPGGQAKMRVVMLGETYEHLDLDADFLAWVKQGKVLQATGVVLEWVNGNPLAHNNPQSAPVGNYMFSALDQWVRRASD